MTVKEIRDKFLHFFENKKHTIVPSSPMVIKDDPTLLFTNAGMNPFKEYFLGNATPQNQRVTDAQKCLRVSGKHNDLEEVGRDTYHHTMFEMLGNWSFGDYFKEEAIAWAWELLTEEFKLNKEDIYVTIFEGDEEDNVPRDSEAYDFWKKWIDEERIIAAGKTDNFWEMGSMGPCGPASEIHIDIRSEEEKEKISGKSLVNQDHPLVIEIWNLVFMQYNRKADGTLESLPQTHVDTGMGLERLAMVLQGKKSNYETDLFQKLIYSLECKANVKYGEKEEVDVALRVIADHIRAISFAIADGQLPSNNGAGYVIRRILRRAVRYGYQTLHLEESFLSPLSHVLVELMGEAYPELQENEELISKVIKEEEMSFFKTLEQGIHRIDSIINQTKKENKTTVSGAIAFELYDTYGFPFDLTKLIVEEASLEVEEQGFNKALQEQKDRSRSATTIKTDDWTILQPEGRVEFVGYDTLETEAKLIKYRKVVQKKKELYQLVFDCTPFYPEGGGQVGDRGFILSGDKKTSIIDTKKENNLIVHFSKDLPQNPEGKFQLVVDKEKRRLATANHSATHLLHHALREVLGEHVAQKGSLVAPEHLRFDFSHFSKMTSEELQKVEQLVNRAIWRNAPLQEERNLPIKEAENRGAMMLFGEKYGEKVRVIQFGDSIELCGGTHIQGTGSIGWFKILSESSVASGVRRIEAITNTTAEQYVTEKLQELTAVSQLLKKPNKIEIAVKELMDKNRKMEKELEEVNKAQIKAFKEELKQKIVQKDGVSFLEAILPIGGKEVKDILFQLKGEEKNLFAIIGGKEKEKCTLSIIISDDLVKTKDWNAGKLIKSAARHIQGGGGGQPFFATAGGKNPEGLITAIEEVKAEL